MNIPHFAYKSNGSYSSNRVRIGSLIFIFSNIRCSRIFERTTNVHASADCCIIKKNANTNNGAPGLQYVLSDMAMHHLCALEISMHTYGAHIARTSSPYYSDTLIHITNFYNCRTGDVPKWAYRLAWNAIPPPLFFPSPCMQTRKVWPVEPGQRR